jgi:hypothetical protein
MVVMLEILVILFLKKLEEKGFSTMMLLNDIVV